MTRSFLLLVIYILCVYRIAHLITDDAITAPLREWLRDRSHVRQVREVSDRGTVSTQERMADVPGASLWVWRWATCSWCISLWIAAGCVLGWLYAASWFNFVAAVFALSGAAGILSERV